MKPDHFTLPLGFRDELVVDNFAGGGGASTGLEQALGRSVDIAINHDPEAVAMHAINHPGTTHYCESVYKVDPEEITGNQPVGLAWFSPDCKHFSKAKGSAPVSPRVRGLAWVVVRWARRVKPRVIMLENVEEFQDWGPLGDDGQPCKVRKGKTFTLWCNQLRRFGYVVESRELRACDYGAPTTRKRLFVIARRDGRPIVWPAPTHGAPTSEGVRTGKLLPYRTAAECIDWSIPCPSIFERKKPLAENTMRRIARGIMRYVVDSADPFIVPVTHGGDSRVHSADEPMRTVTTAHGGEFMVAQPFIAGLAHGDHAGGAGKRVSSLDDPIGTVHAGGGNFAVVTPFIAGVGGRRGQSPEISADRPMPTTTSKADAVLVVPSLINTRNGERDGQLPRVHDIEAPAPTVTAQGSQGALVAAFLAKHYGDTGQRPGSKMDEPVDTITACDHHALVAAHVTKFRDSSIGSSAADPLHTVTAGGGAARPGTGNAMGVVTSHLTKLRGTSTAQAADDPLHTISAGGTHFAEVRALLLKFYGTDQDPRLTEPLHTVTTKDRFGLVTVKGEEYAIVDIGMRMLQPRELFRAQGFPADYVIEFEHNGKPLPKHAQVRMCGNSVCPPLAKALVEANFVHEKLIARAA